MNEHVEYAGLLRRLGAFAIDYALFSVLAIVLYWLMTGNTGIVIETDREGIHVFDTKSWFDVIVFMVAYVIMWVRVYGTPGKLLLGCHVVDARTLQPIGYKQAFLRYVAYLVSIIPLGLGFIWIALDQRRQGFHDKIAKTVVIYDSHHDWDDESEKTLEQLVSELR